MFAHFLSPGLNLQFTWADVYGPGTAHKRMHTADCGKGVRRVGRNAKCGNYVAHASGGKCGKGFKAIEKE
jgi:hypothetical protein